jgi:hypothetical protein
LSNVRYSKRIETQRFGNWICFRLQERRETPTLLATLKALRLALSKRHDRVGFSLFSPEDGHISSFRHLVLSSYLEYRMMDKVQKPSDSVKVMADHVATG